jgi:hypothetical protein
MAYSTDDGATWTEVDVTQKITYIYDIVFANGTFVVVGARNPAWNAGYALTSTDGISWSATNLCNLTNNCGGSIPGYQGVRTVAYVSGKFVAAFTDGSIATSTDATTWTHVPMRISDGALTDVIGQGDSVVSFGKNGNQLIATTQWSQDTLASSDGGSTWSKSTDDRVAYPLWIGDRYVAADLNGGGIFWFSADGQSWDSYWIDGNTDQNNDSNNPSTFQYGYQFRGFVEGGGKILAYAQTFTGGKTLTSTLPATITPAAQTVSGQAGTGITASTAFTTNNFSGAVSYAVTGANQIPAGLTLDANTGVLSGTPTAASTDTITITATGATSGTATATVTFAITAAPPPPPPVVTTPPTTAPPTTLPPGVPSLVNDDNQEELTQAPGGATAIVNGQPVAVEVQAPADLPAANVDPEDRTPAQVQQLQQAANEIVDRLADVAGGNPSVSVEPTPTGAVITGLLTENVPVEDVVLVETPETATLFAALNGDGTVTEVNPGGVIQVLGDGTVGVLAYGLTPGENVELVIMSDPQLLGSFEVNDKGEVKVQAGLPDGLGAGNHTLVVASPTIQASLGLQVAERPLTLPVTGGDTDTLAPVLVMLSLGAILVVVARRRITLVP